MADVERIRAVVAPLVEQCGVVLYDVELSGTGRARTLRIFVTRDASDGGIGIDEITQVTRALDGPVDALIDGAFLLEVSSPGLERALRRPEHFVGAIGTVISVKYRDESAAMARQRGTLRAATDDSVTIDTDNGAIDIAIQQITAAHTVFEWGPAPRPGQNKSSAPKRTKETTRS